MAQLREELDNICVEERLDLREHLLQPFKRRELDFGILVAQKFANVVCHFAHFRRLLGGLEKCNVLGDQAKQGLNLFDAHTPALHLNLQTDFFNLLGELLQQLGLAPLLLIALEGVLRHFGLQVGAAV